MKLYKRQLKSIEDLKREKVLLEYVKGESDAADLFTMEGLKKSKKKGEKKLSAADSPSNNAIGALMEVLGLGSGTEAYKGLMPFVESNAPALRLAQNFLPKKQLKKVFWEIVSGYLKWRAVEGGVWLVKKGIQRYKEKKRFEKAAVYYDPRRKRRCVEVKKKKFLGIF